MFPNGSVLLAYRGGGDGVALGGGIGIAYSTHWNYSLFNRVGEGEMLFSAEDATLWREKHQHDNEETYSYHMLVHRFASGNGSTSGTQVGGHAFSLNGFSDWNYDSSLDTYTTTVNWKNGTSSTLYRRERPKLLSVGNKVGLTDQKYLFNGAWPCHLGPENVDRYDSKVGCQSVTMIEEIL